MHERKEERKKKERKEPFLLLSLRIWAAMSACVYLLERPDLSTVFTL